MWYTDFKQNNGKRKNMKICDIQTPALVVDLEKFRKNAEKMKNIISGASLSLRPHYKSHKCAEIAHEQIKDGAIGLCCAKLSEAEDLIDAGIEDVLIANQIVDKAKIARLAYLARAARLTVCVDNEKNILDIEAAAAVAGSTVYCLVEFEIGMRRCGVKHKEDVSRLVSVIDSCPHLVFDGIQAYAGHISHSASHEERRAETEKNSKKIKELISYLSRCGIDVRVLSGGSTGTSVIKAGEGLYTELQCGSYLFMDSTYRELGLPFENSLFVLATVVSVSDGLVVVDAGVKSCGVDQGMPVPLGFTVSRVVDSEEHFQLHNPSKKFSIGDKVLLLPAHCCSTVNLHDKIYALDGEKVIKRYQITARGRFN